jgi:hypothetical protein
MIPMNRDIANAPKSREHNEQATFIDHVLWTYRNREDFNRGVFFAVPNGAWLGGRAKNVMNKLKGEGFLPGVFDILYLQPREPMGTVTSKERFALVEPFIIPFFGEREGQNPRSHSVNEPLPTITSHGAGGLVQPFLVEYHGTGDALSVDLPLKTQTGRDRFALVEPMLVKAEDGTVYSLDILFRMLHPRELAGAMSFPKDYQFQGNREQVVKQIGNAVPVWLAYALCHFLLRTRMEA